MNNTTDIRYYLPRIIPLQLYLGIIFASGLVGNVIVVYIYGTKYKQNATRILILALAGLDLLCCLSIPMRMVQLAVFFEVIYLGSEALCKTAALLPTYNSFGSGLILTIVAGDRYQKICTPHKRLITTKNAKMAVIITCVVSAVLTWPTGIMIGGRTVAIESLHINVTYCLWSDRFAYTWQQWTYVGMQELYFVVLFSLIVTFYVLLWRQVIRLARQASRNKASVIKLQTNVGGVFTVFSNESKSVESTNDSSSEAQRPPSMAKFQTPTALEKKRKQTPRIKKAEKRTTFMLFVLTCVTAINYLPYFLTTEAGGEYGRNVVNMNGFQFAAYSIGYFSYYINSACNPVIYSVCNPMFRQKCKNIFLRTRRK